MQDPRESRQRLILAHEQTRKEVANLDSLVKTRFEEVPAL